MFLKLCLQIICLKILVSTIYGQPQNASSVVENVDKYKSDWEALSFNIEKEAEYYKQCNVDDYNLICQCLVKRIDTDLDAYARTGVTREMIAQSAQYGIKYKVLNKKLYRAKMCQHPERCSGAESFLLKIVKKVPNLDFVLRIRDWPQVHFLSGQSGPVFSCSKTNEYLDILYPTWSFAMEGPAELQYSYFTSRWDLMRHKFATTATLIPWERKESIAFYGGANNSKDRDTLFKLSEQQPNLVLTKLYKVPSVFDIPLEEHCKYKYVFNFRGIATNFRFRHLLLCKSLVFNVGDEWFEFFYGLLKPWVHYIPIPIDSKPEDIEDLISYFRENDEIAEKIAERGYNLIWQNLKLTDVECYWQNLLQKYAKLITYQVEMESDMIEIKSTEMQIYYDYKFLA